MPFYSGDPQFDEVVAALSQCEARTLVHLDTKQEVDIYKGSGIEAAPWQVRYSHYHQLPDPDLLSRALAAGFELREPAPGCGRRRYEIYKNGRSIKAVAELALVLARLLPGVPADAWLWVTASDYDQRGDPPTRPDPWPPAGT
jgi:hypothetical protein